MDIFMVIMILLAAVGFVAGAVFSCCSCSSARR